MISMSSACSSSSAVASPSVVDAEPVQFCVQAGGVGSCLPGKGTSPACTVADREIAIREAARTLLINELQSVSYRNGGSITL